VKLSTICACLASLAFAQQPPDKPAFEVASIKPSDPNPSNRMFIGMKADDGMVHYTNMTLKDCIRAAYLVRDFQIQGPDWMNSARFEITAKLPAGGSMEQTPEMMQKLLAERFRLTLQRDTKEHSVYSLVVGKNGPKLKPALAKADDQPETALGPDGKPRQLVMIAFPPSGIVIRAPAASLAVLAETISRFSERPVVDMTGLEGQYQFELIFTPETMGDVQNPRAGPDGTGRESAKVAADPAPPVFEAVQEYGLKLEARKAPIAMLTVTHVEKTPTDN
jgi:uncharacterized protein (TIGR03435 family)